VHRESDERIATLLSAAPHGRVGLTPFTITERSRYFIGDDLLPESWRANIAKKVSTLNSIDEIFVVASPSHDH
jgi:hypothetical protein